MLNGKAPVCTHCVLWMIAVVHASLMDPCPGFPLPRTLQVVSIRAFLACIKASAGSIQLERVPAAASAALPKQMQQAQPPLAEHARIAKRETEEAVMATGSREGDSAAASAVASFVWRPRGMGVVQSLGLPRRICWPLNGHGRHALTLHPCIIMSMKSEASNLAFMKS